MEAELCGRQLCAYLQYHKVQAGSSLLQKLSVWGVVTRRDGYCCRGIAGRMERKYTAGRSGQQVSSISVGFEDSGLTKAGGETVIRFEQVLA